ncbi:MAG TPA: dihydroorotate dehydrogenase-like protein [Gemmatimonadales bacterium]|nr:dihydroorotate dehydrogenase-like protein [Gemmatimonadales bacterium]
MPALSTTYLGLPLAHPVVASASPLGRTLDGVRSLEDGGAAAIVLASLFEEQIIRDNESFARYAAAGTESFAESLSYFPPVSDATVGPDEYLKLVADARAAVHVPVIASLNGATERGWVDFATLLEAAGAHALELNIFYLPVSADATGRAVEDRYVHVVQAVRNAIRIPLAVKLSPYFSAFGEMAGRLVNAGANGLVLFNRFYQPDFDLDKLEVVPNLELSTPNEIRLPLLWIAVLRGRIKASLAATSGVHTAAEVVKCLLAGADAVMTTSAVLRNGVSHFRTLVDGLTGWMEDQGYESVAHLQGAMSQHKVADPEAFERANYVRILQSWH